ncbi:MAG TPA: NUDIX domain-containing protein [Candidatus Saccharimonadales bacterium]|nr:NUDIX domain-containing protein [Candidatus Saccharimonadales bacterium]
MAEPKFIPKPGQVDFTNVRYAPVINTVVVNGDEILLLRRSKDLRLYPAYWNGISGFLDDKKAIEQKVSEEFLEELGVEESQFKILKTGRPFLQEAPEYKKTWLVVPVHVGMASQEFKLDWESQEARWFKFHQLNSIKLMPGYQNLIKEFYPDFNL